ncbi:cysteine peptidase family C39 domain-containing protein, partial [Candidatus Dojkabacteria bacterium]|nr:cysteine peptidase family C39 domain-containing protein [Candidatus Dojkabacteria bacterium]
MKEIHQQEEGYCGPAVIQDILHQEGMFATQSEIADVCSTTNAEGTSHLGLLRGARELGLRAFKVQGMRIDQIADFLPKHYVIVNWMSGPDEAEDGHYGLIEKVENNIV